MTLSTQTSKAAFSGNGVTTSFPLPFPFLREADINAVLRRGGMETPLVRGEHYALSGAGAAGGGSLTMLTPPATGDTLVAWRAPALVQEVDYVENAAFPAETHESALDLLTMICQSLQEQIDRAVLYPVSTPEEDVLDSVSFLGAMAADTASARASEQNAGASAAQASASASAASASAAAAAASAASAEGVAATWDGAVKVSASDAIARSLSAKLHAGDGLAEDIDDPAGDEALRLSVALAEASGLEFASGLLRVKAGGGLALSPSGLAADAGTTAGKLLQLDEQGRMPAVVGVYTRQQYAQPVTFATGLSGAIVLDALIHQDVVIPGITGAVSFGLPANGQPGMHVTIAAWADNAANVAVSWSGGYLANADGLPAVLYHGKWTVWTFRCLGAATWLYLGEARAA